MRVIPKTERPDRPRRRRRRLRTVSTLPTLFTLGNLICGLAAIHFCMRAMFDAGAGISPSADTTLTSGLIERLLPSFLSIAAGFIFLGLVFDALDGSVARLTKGTSDFGGQLDSLADVVSFGAAPATLVVALLLSQSDIGGTPSPLSGSLAGRAMWAMIAVYVACGGMRLARYNVEHASAERPHVHFSGLPIPGAAVVLAALALLHQHALLYAEWNDLLCRYLAISLPFAAVGLGLLMVSRIPYLHLANVYLRGRRPFSHVVALIFLIAVFWWYKELALAVVVCVYAASGPIWALVRMLRGAPSPDALEPPAEEPAETDDEDTANNQRTA